MPDYSDHYREIEAEIRGVLERGTFHLKSDQHAEVAEFLNHKEYGLALETLAVIILESGVDIGHSTLAVIEDIASRMGLSGEPVVVDLLTGLKYRSALTG